MEENNINNSLLIESNNLVAPIISLRPEYQNVNISFHCTKTGKVIGKFFEKDGVLTFDGELDESGKIFTDFICSSFRNRIDELAESLNKKNNNDDSL